MQPFQSYIEVREPRPSFIRRERWERGRRTHLVAPFIRRRARSSPSRARVLRSASGVDGSGVRCRGGAAPSCRHRVLPPAGAQRAVERRLPRGALARANADLRGNRGLHLSGHALPHRLPRAVARATPSRGAPRFVRAGLDALARFALTRATSEAILTLGADEVDAFRHQAELGRIDLDVPLSASRTASVFDSTCGDRVDYCCFS